LLYIKTLIRAKKRDDALSYFRALVKYVKDKPKSLKGVDLTQLYLEVIPIFVTNGFADQAVEFQSDIDERTLDPRETLVNSVNKMLVRCFSVIVNLRAIALYSRAELEKY